MLQCTGMLWQSFFVKTLLITGQPLMYVLTSIIVCVLGYQYKLARVWALWLTAMIGGLALKSIWQIPLNPDLGRVGWSFPSGHMLVAVAFWGSLWLEFKHRWLWLPVIVLLCGQGWAMHMRGYHQWVDIICAVYFGLMGLGVYYVGIIPWLHRRVVSCVAFMALFNTALALYLMYAGYITVWIWQALGLIYGLWVALLLDAAYPLFKRLTFGARVVGGVLIALSLSYLGLRPVGCATWMCFAKSFFVALVMFDFAWRAVFYLNNFLISFGRNR